MKLDRRHLLGCMCLVIAAGLGACRSPADGPGQAPTAHRSTDRLLVEVEHVGGGWAVHSRRVIRLTGEGGTYRLARTAVTRNVGRDVADSDYDRSAVDLPAEVGDRLREQLLALDVLTLADAPPVHVTHAGTHHYLVVHGVRGNRFRAYAPHAQADDRYARIVALLNQTAERYIDVPAHARRLERAAVDEVAGQLNETARALSEQAVYEAFPPTALLGANVLSAAALGGWVDEGTFAKLGVRIGPAVGDEALALLPDAQPQARALLYVLLQAMLEQSPATPTWQGETARWAQRDPELAQRTADRLRAALADDALRSLLVADLDRMGFNGNVSLCAAAGWLLLTLGDAPAIDAVLDAVEANALRTHDRLSLALRTFEVGPQTVGAALLARLAAADEPVVQRELLRCLRVWSHDAAAALADAGPAEAGFARRVAATVQPMLTGGSPRTRVVAARVLVLYAAVVDAEAVEASLSEETPHVAEDAISQAAAFFKLDLMQATGSRGEALLRKGLDDPVLGDAVALTLASPEEPALMRRLCALARAPGWIDRRRIVARLREHEDPRTIATLVWMLEQDAYERHHRSIAGALGTITGVWHRDPESDPPLGEWWRNWWHEHRDAYPQPY